MSAYPLGMLVTLGSEGLTGNHIPFEFCVDGSEFGVLKAHVARVNPVWKDHSKSVDALVAFQGAQAYVSPNWYATKEETHKVVPTYNYCVVQAHGSDYCSRRSRMDPSTGDSTHSWI